MHRPSTLLVSLLSFIAPSRASFPDTSLLPRQGGCATPGFVPCNPPGSVDSLGVPPIAFNGGGSGFWSSLQSAATGWNPMIKRETEDGLMERQSGGLCCRPAPVQCLYTKDQGVPFCYTPATTRLYFADGSYAFTSNGTYYGADGTFVNYKTGQYTLANGTSGTFTPVNDGTTASSSSSSSASSSVTATSTPTVTAKSAAARWGAGGVGMACAVLGMTAMVFGVL